MFAASRGDDLGQDRDCNLVGCDGAEIETRRRLEVRQTLSGNAPLRERCFQHFGLPPAANKRNVIDFDRERRQQGGFIAAALRRDDDIP